MKKIVGKNMLSLAGLLILLFIGLGTAGNAPNSFMSALYLGDSFVDQDIKKESFNIPDLEMTMIWIEPGKFTMGSPQGDEDRYENEPPHEVTLTQGFWMGKHEVTIKDFRKFVDERFYRAHSEKANALFNSVTNEKIEGKNWRNIFDEDSNMPVVGVSKGDAYAFCKWLTEREHKAGRLSEDYKFELPTEAQWEYACRAGTSSRFSFGDDYGALYHYANYADQSTKFENKDPSHDDGYAQTSPVGSFKPNRWGLYDMHGNVSELCSDLYWKGCQEGEAIDPLGPVILLRDKSLVRGGSWSLPARDTRSAVRRAVPGMDSYIDVGFRVALRRKHTAIMFSLTDANRDWILTISGNRSTISHKRLSSAKISKVIHFPDRQSLGFPKARIQGQQRWVDLPARAYGKLEVPENVEIKLHVDKISIKSDKSLAPLESLKPDDLQAIEISGERIGGAALKHIAKLTGLQEVKINGRKIRDSGLRYLSGLTNLERLDLSNTKIRGPGLDFLKKCPRLHSLVLSDTKLDDDGLQHLMQFNKLQVLRIDSNEVGDLRPLSAFKELKELDLSYTDVTNSELANISTLKNLEFLRLEGTSITGAGLEHISDLKTLKDLDLRKTKVDDDGLAHLSKLTSLEKLSAGEMWMTHDGVQDHSKKGHKGITDEGLNHLSEMRNLHSLSMGRTGITGKGFSYLTKLKNLKNLYLKDSKLNDAGLAHIAGLKSIEVVDISGTRVTDAGLNHLLNLPNLKKVVAVSTEVTEKGAKDFMEQRERVKVDIEETFSDQFLR